MDQTSWDHFPVPWPCRLPNYETFEELQAEAQVKLAYLSIRYSEQEQALELDPQHFSDAAVMHRVSRHENSVTLRAVHLDGATLVIQWSEGEDTATFSIHAPDDYTDAGFQPKTVADLIRSNALFGPRPVGEA